MLPLLGSPFNIGQGFTVNPDGSVELAKNAPTTPSYGLLSLGAGPWDGASAGHYAGSALGALVAINYPNAFSGWVIDIQKSGIRVASIDPSGNMRISTIVDVGGSGPYISFQDELSVGILQRTDSPALKITEMAAQTADALQILSGVSAILAGITAAGEMYAKGFAGEVRSITATDTFGAADSTILCATAGGAYAVNLPAANSVKPGRQYTLKKTDSSANAATLTRAGADTIEGATTVALTTQYSYRTVASDGVSVWYIIGGSLT